jgi:hypothetical protein
MEPGDPATNLTPPAFQTAQARPSGHERSASRDATIIGTGGQRADLAQRAVGTGVHRSSLHGDFFMAMGHDSIMVGKSYRTPGDEVRTVQSIENDEVIYRAACGASPTMIARTDERKCSLAEFAAEVEAEVSPGV